MHLFHQFLQQQVNISDEDWQIFSSYLEQKVYPAKTFYLKEGETENYASFIERGIVRLYVADADNNETTCAFCVEGWFLSIYTSFLTRQPSRYYAETITETCIWRLHYDDLQQLYARLKGGEKIGRLMAEHLFILKAERELSLLTKSAEERYLELLQKAPHLFRHVPLKHLASYIGITPQALSRIRKRIS